jgi:release factor glutamine methyltransferase
VEKRFGIGREVRSRGLSRILILARDTNAYSAVVTVLEGIQKSAEFLAKKAVDSPRLQAELLLAQVVQMPRMKLYLNFERALSPTETNQLREMVQRRGKREPLQHILGSTSFCGLEIAVNRHVLIPRPETELLAETGWNFLSCTQSQPPTALDFGTGSGCIAIALAVKCPSAKIHAIDVSQEALTLAGANAEHHQVTGRIQLEESNGLTTFDRSLRFDLVISNPPYIPSAEINSLEPEVRDYDPRQALDGGADGLDFYRKLAVEAPAHLQPGGKIMLEFGEGQAESIKEIFEKQKWIVEAIIEDYTRRPRILIGKI